MNLPDTADLVDNSDVLHAGCGGTPEALAGCDQAEGNAEHDAQTARTDEATGRGAPGEPVDASATRTPPATLRDFERALRALGYSRLQAEHIARRGFSGAAEPPAAPPETERLRAAAERLTRALKGIQ